MFEPLRAECTDTYLRNTARSFIPKILFLSIFFAIPAYSQTASIVPATDDHNRSHWDSRFDTFTFRRVVDLAIDDSMVFLAGPMRLHDGTGSVSAVVRTEPGAPDVEPLIELSDSDWFESLALSDSFLYVGGLFNLDDGRKNVAAWDRRTASWRPLGEGLGESVREIALDGDGTVYALSNFTREQRAPWIARLHAWDGSGWTTLGDEFEGWVYDMAVHGSDVYVALQRRVNTELIYEIKQFDGTTWDSLAEVDGIVYALAADAGGLYAGGRLDGIAAAVVHGVARWDGVTWEAMGELSRHDRVLALTVEEGRLFASGDFETFAEDGVGNVIAWEGSNWASAGDGANGSVDRLAISGEVLSVAGDFDVAGSVVAHNAAVFDLDVETWASIKTPDAGGIRGSVASLAVGAQGEIYAGGRFSTAGSAVARNVARWDGEGWSALGEGLSGEIRSLHVHDGMLYAGRSRRNVADSVAGLARWNDADGEWSSVTPSLDGQAIHETYAMASANGNLLVGARLSEWSGDTAAGLLSWDGHDWSIIGDSAFVEAIAVDESGIVYAGGYFDAISGTPARSIAKWDGSAWSALGVGLESSVNALAVSDGNLYAATRSPDLYIWNTQTEMWTQSESILQAPAGCTTAIYVLAARRDTVFAGGGAGACVTGDESGSPQGLARWTPEGWSLPDGGVEGAVRSLALVGADLYMGGSFQRAGSKSSMNVARWMATIDSPVEYLDVIAPFQLDQNHPNPFSSVTSISFTLSRAERDVELVIYDLLGREVSILARGPLPAGSHAVDFEAGRLSPGLYLYRLSTGGAQEVRQMIVVR